MLFANSGAILTDAFPANQRGMALGINGVAATSGTFIGLVLGGLLAPINWRLIFLVSVPIGLFCTVWAYTKLHDVVPPRKTSIDWAGNFTFAVGLISVMTGITFGIEPHGHSTMGWTNPVVIATLGVGVALLIAFAVIERRVAEPDVPPAAVPHPRLHGRHPGQLPVRRRAGRADVHADHLAAGDLAAAARLRLRPDPAVGRHLHDAADPGVPHRRAALRDPVRPLRRPALRHRGHAAHRPQLRAAGHPARSTSTTGRSPRCC